jgi:hypothetical protein
VIDIYAREYARLESESALLNSGQPSEDEARRRLRSVQRKLRRLERDRFVIAAIPARNGFDVARRLMSSILTRLRSIAQGARREKKRTR